MVAMYVRCVAASGLQARELQAHWLRVARRTWEGRTNRGTVKRGVTARG
jgi:hypothetical protein